MKTLFEQGLELEKQGNYENALKLYAKAAEQGDSNAQWRIGAIYYTGKGVNKNEAKGLQYVKSAAENGKAEAQFFMCSCFLNGKGVTKDINEAIKWCELSASQGYDKALQFLDEIKYAKICEEIACGTVCSSEDIGVLSRMSVKGTLGATPLLETALLNRARFLSQSKSEEFLHECIDLYEMLIRNNASYKFIVEKELANVCYEIANIYDQELLDKTKALEYYIKSDEYGYFSAKFNIAMLFYDSESNIKNYSKAIYNFKKCTELGIEEGRSHYYLGNCFYWGLGVPVDMELAKKHYISAYEYGFNCDYAIDTVSSELGERIGESSMQEYAESIKKLNLSDEKLAIRINKDLISDFGSTWEKLSDNSRRSLATAMETYVHIYCKGPHKYGNYDFSGVVGGMCRALEIELERCLYTGYIKYLKENDVSPNSFEGKRSFLKRISANDCAYDEKTSNFTLGAIYPTIGEGKKSGDILDSSMIDYLDFAFKNDAFNEGERRVAITNYILSLADSVYTIAEQHRNAAAHTEVIKCKRAEICGDHIIKVQKLLCKFVEKIKK